MKRMRYDIVDGHYTRGVFKYAILRPGDLVEWIYLQNDANLFVGIRVDAGDYAVVVRGNNQWRPENAKIVWTQTGVVANLNPLYMKKIS